MIAGFSVIFSKYKYKSSFQTLNLALTELLYPPNHASTPIVDSGTITGGAGGVINVGHTLVNILHYCGYTKTARILNMNPFNTQIIINLNCVKAFQV